MYERWARFKPGAWIETIEETVLIVRDKTVDVPSLRSRTTLIESRDGLVILEARAPDDKGLGTPLRRRVYACRLHRDLDIDLDRPTEGEEEVEVQGVTHRCRRLHARGRSRTETYWYCDAIPGGIAQVQRLHETPSDSRRVTLRIAGGRARAATRRSSRRLPRRGARSGIPGSRSRPKRSS